MIALPWVVRDRPGFRALAPRSPCRGCAPVAGVTPWWVEVRDLETAQHEAAHVVVGVACGLRLVRAEVASNASGFAWFRNAAGNKIPKRRREAWALMAAAGPAWERMLRLPTWRHNESCDVAILRSLTSGRHGVETVIRAATAMLGVLTREHARVTHALLERDITGEDIAALCRGEEVGD